MQHAGRDTVPPTSKIHHLMSQTPGHSVDTNSCSPSHHRFALFFSVLVHARPKPSWSAWSQSRRWGDSRLHFAGWCCSSQSVGCLSTSKRDKTVSYTWAQGKPTSNTTVTTQHNSHQQQDLTLHSALLGACSVQNQPNQHTTTHVQLCATCRQ